jgi:hypothetical protein
MAAQLAVSQEGLSSVSKYILKSTAGFLNSVFFFEKHTRTNTKCRLIEFSSCSNEHGAKRPVCNEALCKTSAFVEPQRNR